MPAVGGRRPGRVTGRTSPGTATLINTAALAAPFLIDRIPTGRLTVLIAWSVILPIVPLVFWAHPAVTGGALFVLLLLNPAGNAGIRAYRIAITPAPLQGRVEATSAFLSMSALPLAPLLGGLLLGHLGGPIATLVLAIATAATALVVTFSRSVRCVPRPALWPSHPATVTPAATT